MLICFGIVGSSEYVALPIAYNSKIVLGLATIISGDDNGFGGNPMTAMVKYFSLTSVRFVVHTFPNPTYYYLIIGY